LSNTEKFTVCILDLKYVCNVIHKLPFCALNQEFLKVTATEYSYLAG